MKTIILANEIGEKLWPLATAEMPKALLSLYSQCSMLEEAILRCLPFCVNEGRDIYVVTTTAAVKTIKHKELHSEYKIPAKNLIGFDNEDIAAVMNYVIKKLSKTTDENEIILFIPADQFFYPVEGFLFHLNNLIDAVGTTHKDKLLMVCLEPALAASNMNYVKMAVDTNGEIKTIGKTFADDESDEELYTPVFDIADYLTLPDASTADGLVSSKVWCWDLLTWVGRLSVFDQWVEKRFIYADLVMHLSQQHILEAAIMNKMIWTLIDNWAALKYLMQESGLFVENPQPNVHLIDSSNNYVKLPAEKEVTFIGVDGLIVIDTEDKLLIATPGGLYEHF
jgi:mannose-1-phosphate guanylyltransferase